MYSFLSFGTFLCTYACSNGSRGTVLAASKLHVHRESGLQRTKFVHRSSEYHTTLYLALSKNPAHTTAFDRQRTRATRATNK